MREETRKICTAFIKGERARAARTYTDGAVLFLHENAIAWWNCEYTKEPDNKAIVSNWRFVSDVDRNILHMSCCGWGTPTTFDRLNGLLQLLSLPGRFFTQKGVFYFGSILRPIDVHETITINVTLARELFAADERARAA